MIVDERKDYRMRGCENFSKRLCTKKHSYSLHHADLMGNTNSYTNLLREVKGIEGGVHEIIHTLGIFMIIFGTVLSPHAMDEAYDLITGHHPCFCMSLLVRVELHWLNTHILCNL